MTTSRLLLPLLSLALSLSLAPSMRAEDNETPVKDADVPKAVVDAVAKKYPGSVVKAWAREEEDKKVAYEAKVELASKDPAGKETVRRLEAMLAEDGKILAEEEVVAADTLPAAVRKAIDASKYAKAAVKRVERKIIAEKADDAQFEVVFEADGKKHEVTFDAAGKILEEEDAEGSDEKDGGMEGKDGKDGKDGKPCAPPTPATPTTPTTPTK